MFKELEEINSRPAPFQFYTAKELSQVISMEIDDPLTHYVKSCNYLVTR